MPEGGAQYSVMCNDDGGVLDDLFTYRLSDSTFLTVTNAANHEKDLAWMRASRRRIRRRRDRPPRPTSRCSRCRARKARALVRGLTDGNLPARFHCASGRWRARRCSCAAPATRARTASSCCSDPTTRRASGTRSRDAGATPVGLGARDTLRLEVCFHLYGNDLSEDRGPIEAGLGWACREATGFIGSEAVAAARRDGTAEKLVPFAIDGQGIARQGNAVVGGGEVTSGTFSPCLERGIGMAYVSSARAAEGTQIEIDVRGRVRPAVIERKPLYRKEA